MKILFIGNLNKYGRSSQRFRVFKELGHEVIGLSFVPFGYKPGIGKDITVLEKAMYKLGYPLDKIGINKKILNQLNSTTFDLLWIEKGLMVWPSTLKHARTLHPTIKIISYTEDDMFARHNQSIYYRKCLPLYDVVFTTKSYNCNPNELPALGAKKVVFVDKSFDKHTHRPVLLTEGDEMRFGADVGFIGTFEEDRAEKMLFLATNGVRIRIWGNGWNTFVDRHSNLQIENRPIFGNDYVKAICATKINLCFLRKLNRDLQTDRTMEIPACGGFMLAERTEEHLRLFKEGVEAEFFDINKPSELLQKVKYYLTHEDKRITISKAGRERCIRSGYGHHDRVKQMLAEI